jgi:hypothetical protein
LIYQKARSCKLKEDAFVGFRTVSYKHTKFFKEHSKTPIVSSIIELTIQGDFSFGDLFLEFLVVEKKEMLSSIAEV